MKKGKWSPIKEILFTYLAINKIMYWFYTITTVNQSDLESIGRFALMRLINQDLILIIGVIACYFLNKLIALKRSKYSNILEYAIFYVIGYVVLMGIGFIYNLIINLIFLIQDFSLTAFVREFMGFVPSFTLGYLVVATVLETKEYFKKKGKESPDDTPSAPSTDDKLAMLKVLLDSDILGQEESDHKKQKLLQS